MYPWSCRAIGNDPEAMQLAPEGTLSSKRPELQVGPCLWLGIR